MRFNCTSKSTETTQRQGACSLLIFRRLWQAKSDRTWIIPNTSIVPLLHSIPVLHESQGTTYRMTTTGWRWGLRQWAARGWSSGQFVQLLQPFLEILAIVAIDHSSLCHVTCITQLWTFRKQTQGRVFLTSILQLGIYFQESSFLWNNPLKLQY